MQASSPARFLSLIPAGKGNSTVGFWKPQICKGLGRELAGGSGSLMFVIEKDMK